MSVHLAQVVLGAAVVAVLGAVTSARPEVPPHVQSVASEPVEPDVSIKRVQHFQQHIELMCFDTGCLGEFRAPPKHRLFLDFVSCSVGSGAASGFSQASLLILTPSKDLVLELALVSVRSSAAGRNHDVNQAMNVLLTSNHVARIVLVMDVPTINYAGRCAVTGRREILQ